MPAFALGQIQRAGDQGLLAPGVDGDLRVIGADDPLLDVVGAA
jgi:hypothetical protein